jgi:hypothetical protein
MMQGGHRFSGFCSFFRIYCPWLWLRGLELKRPFCYISDDPPFLHISRFPPHVLSGFPSRGAGPPARRKLSQGV